MDFIKFESSRDKERIRQQLREARDQMLDQAKLRREQRLQREAERELRGETNWVLPTVAAKIEKLGKKASESKRSKRRKEKAKSKKIKKSGKYSKKRKKYSSSESDPDTSEVDTDDSSSDGEPSSSSKKKKKRKKKKEYSSSGSDSWDMPSDESSSEDEKNKSTKSTSKKQKNGKESSSTSCSDSDSSTDTESSSNSSSEEDVRRKLKRELKRKNTQSNDGDDKSKIIGNKKSTQKDTDSDEPEKCFEKPSPTTNSSAPLTRDSWMTDPLLLKTFSKERKEKSAEKQSYEAYDPAKSARELNPYWKSTGTGLPGFKKPMDENEDESDDERLTKAFASASSKPSGSSASRNWRKTTIDLSGKKEPASMSIYSSDSSDSEERVGEKSVIGKNFLTDQQMNELGAKLLKAEIMGNNDLAAELKLKLENARKDRAAFKERKIAQSIATTSGSRKQTEKGKDEHVLLTRTDERGNTRPLAQTSGAVDERDLYGGRNARRKQRRIETHAADGERMRYFPDDDKYDIKQMFEREKYTSSSDANLEFAKIAGKHNNPNDDLDDIFADEVRKDVSQSSTDRKEIQRAINEHQRFEAQLDKCRYCIDSAKMDKSLLVSLGVQVYLALPWHIGMQPGHCVISTTQHVSCCTQLDEDTWSELNDFRKALTRMFAAQKKDVVFFEIASRLSLRPHLSIHCVPIPDEQAEMAPFYFKKAVEESELEWSVNKQLIPLGRDGKSLRNCIPKGLPYFWVNFGMDTGFAHVIEDEDRFPANFALEIIGGILELDAKKWRKPQKEQNTIAKVKMFADWWKKYDCTK